MKKISIIITLLLLFCIGCRRHCSEFPANLNYFPYSKKQKLEFINSQRDIQTLIVSDKESSKSYFLEMYSKGFCNAYSNVSIHSTQNIFDIRCSIKIKECVEVNLICDVQNTVQSDYLTMNLLQESNMICNYDEINKYLSDTIYIEKENNKILTKIFIVKNKGIVSYTTADGEEWKLVE